ncbi:hypothetical protein L218DRAFT_1007310 [Marasmius fiardii PR-910]|nr:hypothetical protein L218DRAFT_1007310 [Marasmius fiardii PR-910]
MEDIFLKSSEAAKNKKGRADIPPCPPSHRRLPHVIKHIEHLETQPGYDYLCDFVTIEGGEIEFTGVSLDEISGAACFIHMRNILFTTTDSPRAEQALLYVYQVLRNFASDAMIVPQLKKEYGVQIWEGMLIFMKSLFAKNVQGYFHLWPITRVEIDVVLGFLEGTDRFEEELAPWRPGEGENQILRTIVGPQKDVFTEVEFPVDATPPTSRLLPVMNTRPLTGATAIGPNFRIPKPRNYEEYQYSDYTNLADQIKWLQITPTADYMIWGHPSAPTNQPMALTIVDPTISRIFNTYRYQLFRDGPFNCEALVYIILTIRSCLRRKIPEKVLLNQLRKECSTKCIDCAMSMISGREMDGKEIWTSFRTGKEYTIGEILLNERDDMRMVVEWLIEVGRA